ncbi:MAG: cysteine hydrolase [Thaumarchaeota archaeon]|nr:cysteine hydrolase [Nitrososphaerota archaeon]
MKFVEAVESYAAAGIGAVRGGFGLRPGLLIVDMQNDLVGPWSKECVTGNAILLRKARDSGIPVFFTRATVHPSKLGIGLSTWKPLREGKVVLEGTKGVQIIDELSPRRDEFVVVKRRPSAFFGTDLDVYLRSLGLDTLIITGVTTSGCVRCTITDAFMRDYKVIVPRECVSEQSKTVHKNNLFDIDAKYGEVVSLKRVLGYLDQLTPNVR